MALMPVEEALDRVLADAAPLPPRDVPLDDALGCILASDLAARRTQPPAAVSAMDGYAIRAADTTGGATTLRVVGEVAAGHPFEDAIGPGEAARIFTGGVMPAGTDSVVIQEVVTRDGDSVAISKPVRHGHHVRAAGIDFTDGAVLMAAGRRLTGRDLMLAAAMNYPKLKVVPRPVVAILATGDELVAPGSAPGPGEIVYSNGFALAAMCRSEGAKVLDLGIARDRVDDIAGAVRRARAAGADILLTTGGASVGEHDLVQQALTGEGLSLSFWRVALRPGRPMMHGRLGGMHVLGLPGNPVSSFVCAFLFLVPLIRRLSGRTDVGHQFVPARLGCDMPANDERADYLRATVTMAADGVAVATPMPNQDSSLMAPLATADALLIRERHAPAASAGSPCVILKLGL